MDNFHIVLLIFTNHPCLFGIRVVYYAADHNLDSNGPTSCLVTVRYVITSVQTRAGLSTIVPEGCHDVVFSEFQIS